MRKIRVRGFNHGHLLFFIEADFIYYRDALNFISNYPEVNEVRIEFYYAEE